MRAIQIDADRNLILADTERPEPGVGEVLIRNVASAVNRADLVQRSGGYPPPPGASPILGLECAGEVVALGEGVESFRPGEQVCALLSGGGYAEYVAVPAGQVLRVPEGLSSVDAAALPEVFATAWLNLFMEAHLTAGARVLLHAGASGVGTAGIQLCRAFGASCWVTVGSDDKLQRCIELGASGGTNRHTDSFAEHVDEWTGGAGFDIILDPVGAAYLADNQRALALEGRLVLIGLMGGASAELNLGLMMMKRQRIIGSTLRARSVAAKAAVMDQLRERVWPLIARGEIRPIIDAYVPLAEAQRAHDIVAADGTFGKVVLTIE